MMIFVIILLMKYYQTLSFLLILLSGSLTATSLSKPIITELIVLDDTMLLNGAGNEVFEDRPHPFLKKLRDPQKKNKKLACAIMAFPFPFGIVGLHRIYMGTAPYVPIVYIASLGGVFGILPLIDFIVILCKKNPEQYFGNRKVFMWID
jgi:TM2 domain-containing membrane protein YozV